MQFLIGAAILVPLFACAFAAHVWCPQLRAHRRTARMRAVNDRRVRRRLGLFP